MVKDKSGRITNATIAALFQRAVELRRLSDPGLGNGPRLRGIFGTEITPQRVSTFLTLSNQDRVSASLDAPSKTEIRRRAILLRSIAKEILYYPQDDEGRLTVLQDYYHTCCEALAGCFQGMEAHIISLLAQYPELRPHVEVLCTGLGITKQVNNRVVICGSINPGDQYAEQAEELREVLTREGYVVFSGIGATKFGPSESRSSSFGEAVLTLVEPGTSPISHDTLLSNHSIFSRGLVSDYLVQSGLVVFPGGPGTVAMACGILQDMLDNLRLKAPIILVGEQHWTGIKSFEQSGMITEGDVIVVNTNEEVLHAIRSYTAKTFVASSSEQASLILT